ncbi:prolactin regulatory element-binding protein [Cryptococcus neoformans C23]|uniref:Prolactin regulatory element-binding protein n=1 Tax=Cryptococcus neoformans (strain H99 / ATCC 208821 / CBS 10515 / FGSC 9487) TaxID=235443 RepID=J9VUE1_CRYN9|nr:prolactin regulatory element-binding protein [Cryptococcus neoformans var. grubii H99]AFR98067.1 prolactin regulatory element-binding protein [Cryptococcus neoformans var. grubii H99]AUB28168.1 prolactin regulatory element-binding protein [Cryptococcus neoformans var. grubii]OWZ33895.1 prolactin regulatory element-binding protein [Cryptococcus neoformans var. grubii AD2-60a]OWZ46023.1 prolactin regulatory element-binding protein [Cryptococcus neoformans var. grubii C23]|eukprot:XP_012052815.1 prolactin regulatory element-binding protein [Cryptococcus neoformans var. grubii H99]
MTRTAHHPHPTPSFPVYCLDWADDAKLILGGGGGATRSGIQNKLKLCKVSKDGKSLSYLTELALSNDEDAPMTMAIDKKTTSIVTGINGPSSAIQAENNDHCRVYSFSDNKIELVGGQKTIGADWSDDYPYQKFTVLSPSSKLLAVGSTDDRVSILHFPSLEPVVPAFSTDSELVDLDWGGPEGEWLSVATTTALLIYQRSSAGKALTLKQTVYAPSFDIVPAIFRSARFSRNPSTPFNIHAVLNSTKPAKRGAARKAWVCTFGVVAPPSQAKLTEEEKATAKSEEEKGKGKETASDPQEDVGKWDVLIKREVAGKPVTVFDVSSDGRLLSYGCSDLSIGILDSKTLAPLLKILHAHSFPPTALKFNPSASLLVSASADNTVRAIVVPANFGGLSTPIIILLLTLLMLILALAFKR